MIPAHKIALRPNNVQATHLATAAGTARLTYNWALAKPSQHALRRRLHAIKRYRFPWMHEVTKNAP